MTTYLDLLPLDLVEEIYKRKHKAEMKKVFDQYKQIVDNKLKYVNNLSENDIEKYYFRTNYIRYNTGGENGSNTLPKFLFSLKNTPNNDDFGMPLMCLIKYMCSEYIQVKISGKNVYRKITKGYIIMGLKKKSQLVEYVEKECGYSKIPKSWTMKKIIKWLLNDCPNATKYL